MGERVSRLRNIDHRRQFFVVDHHRFERGTACRDGLRQHRDHRLADKAHDLVRQRAPRRRGTGAAIGAFHERAGGNRLDAGGDQFRAGDHRDHAGHRPRSGRIDRHDARMRIGRAQENEVRLALEVDVIGIAASAGHQGAIFQALDGLAAAETGET